MTNDDYCTTCRNTGLMNCDRHGVEVDEDNWCATCDTPMDDPIGQITCRCQDA